MNDGSTEWRSSTTKKHLTVCLNKTRKNDVTIAMKTVRAEQRYNIRYRVLDRATNWKTII